MMGGPPKPSGAKNLKIVTQAVAPVRFGDRAEEYNDHGIGEKQDKPQERQANADRLKKLVTVKKATTRRRHCGRCGHCDVPSSLSSSTHEQSCAPMVISTDCPWASATWPDTSAISG